MVLNLYGTVEEPSNQNDCRPILFSFLCSLTCLDLLEKFFVEISVQIHIEIKAETNDALDEILSIPILTAVVVGVRSVERARFVQARQSRLHRACMFPRACATFQLTDEVTRF